MLGQPIEVLLPDRFRPGHTGLRAGYAALPTARSMGAGRDLYGRRKDATEFPVEISLSPVQTEEGLFILAAIVDITERRWQTDLLQKANEALEHTNRELLRAQHLAFHDVLTDLPNRALFNDIVEHQLAMCRREMTPLAILFVDLDRFKAVNDTYGHATGDELLSAVAARLKNGIRSSDLAARLAGDEFCVLLVNTGIKVATAVAAKLAASLARPYPIGQSKIEISASIGIAGFPESGVSCEELLRGADEAMYRAKSERKKQTAASRV